MKTFSEMTLEELIQKDGHPCECGRVHRVSLSLLKIQNGAVDALPEGLRLLGVQKPFVIMDKNTRQAAWNLVEPVLKTAGVPYVAYEYLNKHIEPDEQALGSLVMAFDPACDGIVALGSGVLNDLAKVFAHAEKLPSLVIATAPSMDGYASDSASMIRDRVKVSLYNACPQVILADTRVLKDAPLRLLQAGLGDMLAKYVSVCEWRISNLVTGEYYCENIAGLVRKSLKKIVDNVEGLKNREESAVEAVAEGLVLSGIAMAFAGISRPASGLEHYFSHLFEMMSLERGTPVELHGIQVGIGTLLTLQIWEYLKGITPERTTAKSFMASFDETAWEDMVRRIFGSAAQAVLNTARAEGRNDKYAHQERLDKTLSNWDKIMEIARDELPSYQVVYDLMMSMDMPMTPGDIGFTAQDTRDALHGAREIRTKYLTSSLLFDLGLLYTLPFPFEGK